jgi:hypothetical protein
MTTIERMITDHVSINRLGIQSKIMIISASDVASVSVVTATSCHRKEHARPDRTATTVTTSSTTTDTYTEEPQQPTISCVKSLERCQRCQTVY